MKYVNKTQRELFSAKLKNAAVKTYQNGSLLETLKTNLNPFNWGVPDYTDSGHFDNAFKKAWDEQVPEFMWNGKRYPTIKRIDTTISKERHPNTKEEREWLRNYMSNPETFNRLSKIDPYYTKETHEKNLLNIPNIKVNISKYKELWDIPKPFYQKFDEKIANNRPLYEQNFPSNVYTPIKKGPTALGKDLNYDKEEMEEMKSEGYENFYNTYKDIMDNAEFIYRKGSEEYGTNPKYDYRFSGNELKRLEDAIIKDQINVKNNYKIPLKDEQSRKILEDLKFSFVRGHYNTRDNVINIRKHPDYKSTLIHELTHGGFDVSGFYNHEYKPLYTKFMDYLDGYTRHNSQHEIIPRMVHLKYELQSKPGEILDPKNPETDAKIKKTTWYEDHKDFYDKLSDSEKKQLLNLVKVDNPSKFSNYAKNGGKLYFKKYENGGVYKETRRLKIMLQEYFKSR